MHRLLLVVLGLLVAGTHAESRDLHRWWDLNCGDSCHGHAATFARRTLRAVDGQLIGVHPDRKLRDFLGKHGVPPEDIGAIYEMLLAQVETREVFKPRCGGCHGTAAAFVRQSIIVRDGDLYARGAAKPVRAFLPGHAGIREDEIPFFVDLLTRVKRETGAP
jgi:hypothetical protein